MMTFAPRSRRLLREGPDCKSRYQMISTLMVPRTALLIRCSLEEASKIRAEAEIEKRTVSGYVLNIMVRALRIEDKLAAIIHDSNLNRTLARLPLRMPGPRTAILVRCSVDEAKKIRAAAARRDATISGFVLHSLRSAWRVAAGHPTNL